jgi:multiple sugar transport system ATP-binding protein
VPVLELTGVTKVFRGPGGQQVTALKDISLTLETGELLSVVGPSGSGKTTLLRLVAGLDAPDSGTIAFDGQPVADVPPERRDIAMVFQHGALYPHMTVRENLGFPLRLRKLGAQEITRRVDEASELLSLRDCLNRRPAALSGGQRQRVALGRALVRRPRLFLLDEPLSNLDPPTRLELRTELARLHQELGISMIHVTHDHGEALSLGNRVAVLCEGRLQQLAPPLELYELPVNRFVAGFIGSNPVNFLRGRIHAAGSTLVFQLLPQGATAGANPPAFPIPQSKVPRLRERAGQEVELGIRAEHMTLAGGEAVREDPLLWNGAAALLQNSGSDWIVQVSRGPYSLMARIPASAQVCTGDDISLKIDPERFLFFEAVNGSAL